MQHAAPGTRKSTSAPSSLPMLLAASAPMANTNRAKALLVSCLTTLFYTRIIIIDLTVHVPIKCSQNPETLMDSEQLVDPRRTRSPGIYCHAVARIARCSSIKCCSDLHPEGHTTGTATWQVLAFSMHLAHTSLQTSTTSTTCYLFLEAKADWSHSDLRVHCCSCSQHSSWQLHQ